MSITEVEEGREKERGEEMSGWEGKEGMGNGRPGWKNEMGVGSKKGRTNIGKIK